MSSWTLDLLTVCLWVLLALRLARLGRGASGPDDPGASGDSMFLLGAALALRLAMCRGFSTTPLFEHPLVDAAFYHRWALALAGGHDPYPVFGVDPLYPYVLGGLYRLFGPGPWTAGLLGCLTGALSVSYVHRLSSRLASRPVALFVGTLACLYAPALCFDLLRLKSSLALCLTLAALESFLAARAGGPRRLLAAGALLGLASLNGTQTLALALAFAVALVRGPSPLPRLAALLASASLVIAPATIHNVVVGRQPVLFHVGGGMILWASNNPAAWGRLTALPDIRQDSRFEVPDYMALASRELGRPVTSSEASAYFRDRAVAFLRADPARAVKLVVVRVGLLLNAYEWPDNYDLGVLRLLLDPLSLPLPLWGLLAPLGLLGLALACGPAGTALPGARTIAASTVLLALPLVVTYSNARLRLPLLAGLLPLSALALDQLVRSSGRRAALLGAPLVAVALMIHGPTVRVPPAPALFNLADVYLREDRPTEACRLYEAALAIDPDHVGSLVNLANLLFSAGRYGRAADLLERAVDLGPRVGPYLYNLGNAYRRSGRPWHAVSAYSRARRLMPDEPQLGLKLGLALADSGSAQAARAVLETALESFASGRPGTLPTSPEERAEGYRALAALKEAGGDRAGAALERARGQTLLDPVRSPTRSGQRSAPDRSDRPRRTP
ncbi:MAG: tetratricopeptide repeat protein [Candidatus Riflebacteria bacterium]|nr:tetratricopeptide repeat protein [Candidatus Riflebacteria bacterium]